jgi:hypothetical protein
MPTTLGPTGLIFPDNTVHTTNFDSTLDAGSLLSISSYTTAGSFTWTKPANCTRILVAVVGGGGGASGYCESGGSGGYSERMIDVTAVSTVTVTVGGAGTAIAYNNPAGAGGTSSFGSYCSATGGGGANTFTNHCGGLGGVGSGGDVNLTGGGGTGHANSAGNGAIARGGRSFLGGSTGANRETNTGKALNGAPGAGGPGSRTDDGTPAGGTGEAGAVIIWEYK